MSTVLPVRPFIQINEQIGEPEFRQEVNRALRYIFNEFTALQAPSTTTSNNAQITTATAITTAPQVFIGTLAPDTRPTTLVTKDIYKAIFFATDFNHAYWWVGTDITGTGTTSGWRAIEDTARKIFLCFEAPVGAYWALCNGVSVQISDYKGDVSTKSLPDLIQGVLELSNVPSDSLVPYDFVNFATLPVCLGATDTIVGRERLMPYMRL